MFERQFLTLLAVAGGAAVVFVWGSAGYQQRDQLKNWATIRCAAAGASYTPPANSKLAAGQACADRIDQLAAFERDTNASTAKVFGQALDEQNQKISTDAALARSAAQAAAAATKRMEAENAAIKDDQVGGAWFGALNQSAGLRAPGR